MENANLFLENTLLILAVLLFLAVLPRALRQKEKTALDKAVERFEREELKANAEKKSDEEKNKQQKPIPLRDGSLAYPKGNISNTQTEEEFGGIPPFSEHEDEEEERVKIVKTGVPISHYETAEPSKKKKIKLIKQEFSIAPDKNKVPSKTTHPDRAKANQSKIPASNPKPSSNDDFPVPPIGNKEESRDNWIEAEIPGLAAEPPAAKKLEDIPVFNAFPKETYPPDTEKPQNDPEKEKKSKNVKNTASKTVEKKDSLSKKQAKTEKDSPQLETENPESDPKEVEIKAPVVSHKSIAKREAEPQKTEASVSKTGEIQVPEAEAMEVPAQRSDAQTSPERTKVKPFLLDLRYLDPEESQAENPVARGKLPADRVDVTIARLNALQTDLENQLRSTAREPVPREILLNETMGNDRIQDSLPDMEETVNDVSDKKEVSIDELDSFLFTGTQRRNRE